MFVTPLGPREILELALGQDFFQSRFWLHSVPVRTLVYPWSAPLSKRKFQSVDLCLYCSVRAVLMLIPTEEDDPPRSLQRPYFLRICRMLSRGTARVLSKAKYSESRIDKCPLSGENDR